jgi:hypothetical protein
MGGACALLSPSATTLWMPDVPDSSISNSNTLTIASMMPPPAAVWNPDGLQPVVDLICTSTPPIFREAVFKSRGRFLYRGDDDDDSTASNNNKNEFGRLCHPLPDLVVPGTYSETNDDALNYFQCLERQLLYQDVRPSNGHLGTPKASDAAAWGQVVSIWPLGSELAYAWPRYRTAFYDPSGASGQNNKQCPGDKIQLDSGLKSALLDGRELLFTSWYKQRRDKPKPPSFVDSSWISAFVAVPIQQDAELRRMLQLRKYGLP